MEAFSFDIDSNFQSEILTIKEKKVFPSIFPLR